MVKYLTSSDLTPIFFPFWKNRGWLFIGFQLNQSPKSWHRGGVWSAKSVEATAGSNTLIWSDEFGIAAFLPHTPGFNSCVSATSKTTLDIMMLACNSSAPPEPPWAITAAWFESTGCLRETSMGKYVQTSFPQKNQTCVSWLSDILGVECMLVYAVPMIIICEDTNFYLLFYYILHISLFTDIAPAHCLLSPLTASWI